MPPSSRASGGSLEFRPPWWLKNGWAMTLYTAWAIWQQRHQSRSAVSFSQREAIFRGHQDVPLYGQVTRPTRPPTDATQSMPLCRGTIVGTYGITGNLEQQWLLHILRFKALEAGYGVVLFDWRAHGKTAELSPTLTSDGLHEGKDFLHIAAQAKAMGCLPPFWFTGYSLGGQLALWALHESSLAIAPSLDLENADIGGAAVICPNLDSNRSLDYLVRSPLGRWLEQSIAKELKRLAWRLHDMHPDQFDAGAIARANSIRQFDQELVIPHLGFSSVEEYYTVSSPLPWLDSLSKPTLILYAADDPMFDPAIVPDLERACHSNPWVDLALTPEGGHVGYFSSEEGRVQQGDRDSWWAWNRILEWLDNRAPLP